MSSKHTPAPWIVRFRADGSSYISMGDPSKGPHKAADLFLAADGGESDLADARLIAAAPELLAIVARELLDGEQSHFENWLERTCPSGDVESVKRQWLESSDYVLFANVYREKLAVLDKIEGNT